jgi:predicted RNA binding protein YcfA (HicA-like mRNA interferase family)
MNKRKLLAKAITGSQNMRFSEAVALVEALGFRLSRIRGSHHIFAHPKVRELVNLQEVSGKAKPYLMSARTSFTLLCAKTSYTTM